jgi:hypothetical protein
VIHISNYTKDLLQKLEKVRDNRSQVDALRSGIKISTTIFKFKFENQKTGHAYTHYANLGNIPDFVLSYDKAVEQGYRVVECSHKNEELGVTLYFAFTGWGSDRAKMPMPDEEKLMADLMKEET